MKKYVKPELFYESFELSQQIAVCDFDSHNTLNDITNCSFTGPNPATGMETTFFLSAGVNGCVASAEGYCVHNSTNEYFNLFNS